MSTNVSTCILKEEFNFYLMQRTNSDLAFLVSKTHQIILVLFFSTKCFQNILALHSKLRGWQKFMYED